MNENYRAEIDSRGYYNNLPVIFFTLWRLDESDGRRTWVHDGKFTAPARTAKKRLVEHALAEVAESYAHAQMSDDYDSDLLAE